MLWRGGTKNEIAGSSLKLKGQFGAWWHCCHDIVLPCHTLSRHCPAYDIVTLWLDICLRIILPSLLWSNCSTDPQGSAFVVGEIIAGAQSYNLGEFTGIQIWCHVYVYVTLCWNQNYSCFWLSLRKMAGHGVKKFHWVNTYTSKTYIFQPVIMLNALFLLWATATLPNSLISTQSNVSLCTSND